MRVLLINSNREVSPWPVIPLGLCYIATTLEQAGHHVHFLDLTFVKKQTKHIRQVIQTFCPEVIGISIRNIDNVNMCDPNFYLAPIQTNIVDICRETSDSPVILGGGAVGIAPVEMMDFLRVDYAIAGDGERAVLELLEFFAGDRASPTGIEGLYYRDGNGTVQSPVAVNRCSLDGMPHPEPYRWIDYHLYEKHGATANIQAKRGCAFQCIYCSYNIIEGKCYRLRDPVDIADEIEQWNMQVKPRCIEFVDSTFNAPMDHAVSICEEIDRRQLKIRFTTMGLNPGCLSDELLVAMKTVGFKQCMCSPDSASPAVLESLQKNFNRDHLTQAVRLFRKHELQAFWFFILGGPGETPETIRETLDFCQNEISPSDVIHITIGFRVFQNTELARIMVQDYGLEKHAPLLEPTFYISPRVEPVHILDQVHAVARHHPNMITYFDMEIYDTLKAFFETIIPFHPPEHNWGHLPRINRTLNYFGLWHLLHRKHRKSLQRLLRRN